MKRILLCAAVMLAATEMKAQITLAPEAGIYNAMMVYKSTTGNTIDKSSKMGPRGGVNVNFAFSKYFFVQSGLFYYQSGSKIAETNSYLGSSSGFKSDISINNLQLPVNLGFNYPLCKAISVFATAGPYVGYALSGNAKKDNYANGDFSYSEKVDYSFGKDKSDNLKRLDLGFNFSVGIKSSTGFYVRGQYGLGLTQLSNVTTTSIKNAGFAASLGYEFKLDKKKK